jgi:uncharacterized FlaG/YvyC family protein
MSDSVALGGSPSLHPLLGRLGGVQKEAQAGENAGLRAPPQESPDRLNPPSDTNALELRELGIPPAEDTEPSGAGVLPVLVEAQKPNGLGTDTNQAKETREELEVLAADLNAQLSQQLSLRFLTDEDTGLDYFQLIEKDTGEVIRQYPPEEMLDLVRGLREAASLLFSQEV